MKTEEYDYNDEDIPEIDLPKTNNANVDIPIEFESETLHNDSDK